MLMNNLNGFKFNYLQAQNIVRETNTGKTNESNSSNNTDNTKNLTEKDKSLLDKLNEIDKRNKESINQTIEDNFNRFSS